MSNFTKKEIKSITIIAIVLSFLFSFRQWGTNSFDFATGLFNWLKFLFFVILSLIIHESFHKFIANKHGATSEMSIWNIKRYGFKPGQRIKKNFLGIISIPIGIIISIILIFISNGYFIFAALDHSVFKPDKLKRIKHKLSELTHFESATIALAGPLISLFLALLFTSLGLSEIAKVNYYLAIYSLLPLPSLDGGKIFLGSRTLYISSLIFTVLSIILIQVLSLLFAIIIAILIAILLMISYYYRFE